MNRFPPLRRWLLCLLAILAFFVAVPTIMRAAAPERSELEAVWARVQASGSYHFSTDVVQKTIPLPVVRHVGREGKETRLHMEGQSDLPREYLHLTLWNGGGGVMQPGTGLEVKVEGSRAYVKQGTQPWEEVSDFTSMFAPGGDFMAYMSGARNVQRLAPETRQTDLGTLTFTRYTFEVDGPAFAQYMREQMEAQLRDKGELPPSTSLEIPKVYADMTGSGELWVGPDGLPLREILRLSFPDRPDQQAMSAEITVNFSDFNPLPAAYDSRAPLSAAALGLGRAWDVVSGPQSVATLAITPLWLALAALFVFHRRSKKLYAALAAAVILSQVVLPLLRIQQQVAFASRQEAQATEQQAAKAEAEQKQEVAEQAKQPRIDPHMDPRARATAEGEARETLAPQATVTLASVDDSDSEYYDDACETSPTGDADSDGLTNIEECRLGTLPSYADSDDDGIDDDEEIAGFTWDGETWYTDPTEVDSNLDGLYDGVEWEADLDDDGLPDDTDNDGTPDLWDQDNDGDGIDDDNDLSPYTSTEGTKTFSDSSPLELMIDNLESGMMTTVQFQIVPTDPDHLWYTYNVLDWPEDKQGQIQDGDSASFYDADTSLDVDPYDNGDVMLIPMLEIEITGDITNLPSDETLEEYNISVQQIDDDTQAVYVPLTLVTSDDGEKNVAFYGEMIYDPVGTWSSAHDARLIWMVQVLNDECEEYEDDICTSYSSYNEESIVQTYDDSWYLAGLQVTEEHGTDIALVYEDPDAETDIYAEEALYELAYGLNQAFLTPMDENNDGTPDITISEIYSRWNYSTNNSISSTDRWGIDDVLTVVKNSYDTADEGLLDTTTSKTESLLNSDFTPEWSSASPVTPTLLFLETQTYRAIGLDTSQSSSLVSWSSKQLTLNLSSTDASNPILEETLNGLSVTSYTYDSSSGEWSSYDAEDYWENTGIALDEDIADGDEELEDAYDFMAELIYIALSEGTTSVVQSGDDLVNESALISDSSLASEIGTSDYDGISSFLSPFKDAFLDDDVLELYQALALSSTVGQWAKQTWLGMSLRDQAATIIVVIAVIALIIYLVAEYWDELSSGTGTLVLTIISAVVALYSLINTIVQTVQAIIKLAATVGSVTTAFAQIMVASTTVIGASRALSIIGLIIAILITIGIFIYLWASGTIEAGTIEFNMVVALTIATIIVTVVLFVIGLASVVGAILIAIFAVVDLILYFTIGFSVTSWLTEQIAKAIYNADVSVDVDVDMGDMSSELVTEDDGYVEGNKIEYTFPLTTSLQHNNPDTGVTDYNQFTEDGIKRNSMAYGLSTDLETEISTTKDARYDDWTSSFYKTYVYVVGQYAYSMDLYQAELTDSLSTQVTLEAGINDDAFPLYLHTAYYLYGYDCWVGFCDKEIFWGNESEEIGESLILDVFPDTLDEFVDTDSWANTIIFKDADGDGLISSAWNGLDPDDSDWDDDDDTLSDAYELEMQALTTDEGGEYLDPGLADTDSDGLDDAEEIRLGTNPASSDTDEDGLSDYAEEEGWTFTYASGKTLIIYSSPINADIDGDGLDDLAEKTLHTGVDTPYNPNVWNENPLGVYTALSDDDAILALNQDFVYTTTAANNLTVDYASRTEVQVELPSGLSGSPTEALMDLQMGESQSLVSNLSVDSSASSASTSLVSSVEATLHTPSVWDWDDPTENSATLTSKVGRAVALAQATDWSTPFAAATMEQCGLTGTYYNNTSLSGTAALTQCEGQWLDYEWGTGSPSSAVNSNSFSASYSGTFYFEAGTYTFNVRSDDGVRLYVDNSLIIDKWFTQSATSYASAKTLTAGTHSIKLEYYENTGSATLQFWWEATVANPYLPDSTNAILAYAADADGLSGSGVTLNDTSLTRYRTAPDVACNTSGTCLASWAEYNTSTSSSEVKVARFTSGPTYASRTTVSTLSSGVRAGVPSVASDGSGFLVAWREYGSSYTIKAHRITSAGATSGSAETLYTGTSTLEEVDLEWADSRYLAVWSDGTDLWHAFVSTTSGFYIPTTTAMAQSTMMRNVGGTQQVTLEAETLPEDLDEYTLKNASIPATRLAVTAASEHAPTVAYDSVGHQALIVYRSTDDSGTHTLTGRILTGDNATEEVAITTLSSIVYDVAASYDPQNAGWVVAWSTDDTMYYQALAGDGTLRGSQEQIAGDEAPPAVALLCIDPQPSVETHFEEASGSTTFTDDSGYSNNLTCTTCPTAGSDGYSGSAVLFSSSSQKLSNSMDLPDSNYTSSFWFKSTCQDCTIYQQGNSAETIYLDDGDVCVQYTTSSSSTVRTNCTAGANFGDDNWHQMTHVAGSSVSGSYLYLDGELEASSSYVPACYGTTNCAKTGITLGSGITGSLDEFALHDRAFSAAEVSDNYTAALVVYAFDEYSSGSTITSYDNDAGNSTYDASCSGTACPTTGSEGKAYYGLSFDGSDDYLTVSGSSRTMATYEYDFESSPDSSVWSSTTRTSTTRNGTSTYYLGKFGSSTVELDLSNLPTHDSIQISYDLYVLDGWDGNSTEHGPDYWEWGYDDTQVLRTTFSNKSDSAPNYQFYPSSTWSPTGVILYEHSGCDGDWSWFTADDSSVSDDDIGNDSTTCWQIYEDTASIFYEDANYDGDDWIQDAGRDYYDTITNDEVTSLRVWAAANDPKTGANSGDYVVYNSTNYPVYSFSKTLSDHDASTLSLYFEGEGLTDEYWGIDNVKITVKSSSVPLKNSSFTLAAWAKRTSSGNTDYIIGQGTTSSNALLHFGYRSSNLFTCGFYNNDLDTSSAYTDVDEWHHWACTYDASTNTRTIYRDGVQVAQGTTTADYSGEGALYIGKYLSTTGYFGGTLDELGIWTQALAAEDVYDLYVKTKILDDSVTLCEMPRATDLSTMPFETLSLRETTTYLGTSSQEVEHDIDIDASAPTASITSLTSGEYVNSDSSLTIGGESTDSFGEVESVDFRINSGSWQDAEGTEAWSYTLDTSALSEGSHSLQVRASDVAGNVGSASTSLSMIVDRTAPTVSSSLSSNALVSGYRDEYNRMLLSLSGSVSDPSAGSSSGSGVVSVEVLLQGQDDVSGMGWQTATVSGSAWSVDYVLPRFNDEGEGMPIPSGVYTLTLRATDNADNTTVEGSYTTLPIQLDESPPVATLTYPISTTTAISSSLTLTGNVEEETSATSGISSVEIRFTPADEVSLFGEALVHLPFDDAVDSTIFENGSDQASDFFCIYAENESTSCPTAGSTGKLDDALSFDQDSAETGFWVLSIDDMAIAKNSFTFAAWAQRSSSGTLDVILSAGTNSGNKGFYLGYLADNTFTCSFYNNSLTTTTTYPDIGEWHHWSCTYDADTNLRTLYRDGVQVAQDTSSSDFNGSWGTEDYVQVGDAFYMSSAKYDGLIDEVFVFQRDLTAHEAEVLYDAGNPTWNSVTLAQSGSTVDSTTWSYTLPTTLDGIYQIDLKATDTAGNFTPLKEERAAWRGEIDTQAPTLSVGVTQSGTTSFTYTCDATDFNLDEESSCVPVAVPVVPTSPKVSLALDETGSVTTFSDSSGNSNNATCSGTACPTAGQGGQVGYAATFDGSDDTLTSSGSSVNLATGDFTIAAWVKTTGTSDAILTKSDGDMSWEQGEKSFYLNSSGQPSFVGYGNNYIYSTKAVNDGTWHHVAVMWNYSGSGTSGTGKIFVDGVDVTSSSTNYAASRADNSGDSLRIGFPNQNESSGYFVGSMDAVYVFARTLAGQELAALYQSPVAHLRLDESYGNTVFLDWTGNGYAASCSGTACPTAGQSGKVNEAATFDGTDDTMSLIGSGINLAKANFTIAAWVKTTGTNRAIVTKSDGDTSWEQGEKSFYLNGSGQPTFVGWGNAYIYSTQAVNDGTWHHVAVTWSYSGSGTSGTAKMYVDGVDVTSSSTNYAANNADIGSHLLRVGSPNQGGEAPSYFSGSMDEVRFFTRALAATDVATLARSGALLHLALDEASGSSTFDDDSGNNNDATCSGTACPTMGESGLIDDAATFDGTNDTMSASGSGVNLATGDFTIAAWVKTSGTSDAILTKSDGDTSWEQGEKSFYLNSSGKPTFVGWGNSYIYSDKAVNDSTWHHVAVTWDYSGSGTSGTAKMYVDGVDVTSSSTAYAANNADISGNMLHIGFPNQGSSEAPGYFSGSMDELYVSTSALSGQEIGLLYYADYPTFRDADVTETNYDEISDWYAGVFTTTERLYELEGSRAYSGYWNVPVILQACDSYGRCTTVSTASSSAARMREEAELAPTAPLSDTLSVGVLDPSDGDVLASTTPITVSGYAMTPGALKDLTVTMNGGTVHSQSWAETDAVTQTSWAFAWTPPAEGYYPFSATATDWGGGTASSQPITVTVDTQAPTIAITNAVLTTTHQVAQGAALLRGTASDSLQLADVTVQVDGSDAQKAVLSGSNWQLPLSFEQAADGTTVNVTATASDLAGHQATATAPILVDLVAPAPVTVTLGYATTGGQNRPVVIGQTLSDAAALTIAWSASSDGSGIQGYWAGWTRSSEATLAELTRYPAAGTHSQAAGEAERWYAHLVVVDTLGNLQRQTLGPVYVDAPATPSLIGDLTYQGWSENLCALVSVDRRIDQATTSYQALSDPQQFYAGWDAQALALAWEGANWNQDGDLFIYLDTQAGGATQLFDPYSTPTTEIFFPGHYPERTPPPSGLTSTTLNNETDVRQQFMRSTQALAAATMEADYLVQIEDEATATLLRWDGTQWLPQQTLDASAFRLDMHRTTLLLPFTWLGISTPATTSLSVLAVATEEEALRLWATAPERNPVSSARVVTASAARRTEVSFALLRPITFTSLANGQCANGKLAGGPGSFADSDLELSLSATPVGSSYGLMQSDLFWLWADLFGMKGGPVPSHAFGFMDMNHPQVADGQTLTYSLHYANRGTEPARGVKVALYGWYSLNLPGSVAINEGRAQYKVLDIGTIPPGTEGTLTFTATVDGALGQQHFDQCLQTAPRPDICIANKITAALNVLVYDERDPLVESAPGQPTRPALEWLWGDHFVDEAPPTADIEEPRAVVRPGLNEVHGYAYDGSAVPTITLEIQGTGGQITRQICQDPTPDDGRWRCGLVVGSLLDGATIQVRVQATDEHGYVSPWSAWRTLTVDTTPPTVTGKFDIPSGVVGQATHSLSGQITDERDIAAVEVCRAGGSCEQATVRATSHTTSTMSVYDDVPATPLALDPSSRCFAGVDIVRTFNVTDDFIVGDVDFGFNADHENRDSIQATLQAPDGTAVNILGGAFSQVDPYRNYDVLLNDSASQPIQGGSHDDTAAPYFEREVRPFHPMTAFNGLSAKGTWTLRICNGSPEPDVTGQYNRSRLYVGPQSTVLYPKGEWSYVIPSMERPDGVAQELGIYGLDRAGNRTTQPVTLTYELDQVAPVLTVTQSSPQVTPFQQGTNLAGQVSDGSGQAEVSLRVLPPTGSMYRVEAAVRQGRWSFTLTERANGSYKVWAEARDAGGNLTIVGPYTLQVGELPTLYLPIMRTAPPSVRRGAGDNLLYLPVMRQPQ